MNEDIQVTQKSSPLIPAIAILGFGLAIIASAVGGLALMKISRTTEDINARIEKNAAVELEIKKLSDRIDSVVMQIEEIKSSDNKKVANLTKQVQQVVDILQTKISENRTEIAKNREGIEQIASRRQAPVVKEVKSKTEDASTKSAKQAQENVPTQTASESKAYKIQNGDTFAKLAKKFNVSIDALLKANPQANPSRLKIGQEIVIPQ